MGVYRPLLSVVIANWNACDLLRGCLQSLRDNAPALCDLEVIVVDDGSADGSAPMVQTEFPEVRLLQNSVKQGFTRANNRGLAESSGDLLLAINPDMVVHPGCLDRLCEIAMARPDLGIIAAQLYNADGTLQRHRYPFITLYNVFCFSMRLFDKMRTQTELGTEALPEPLRCSDPDCPHTLIYTESLAGACHMMRREVFEKIGLMDEQFPIWLSDDDWCKSSYGEGYQQASVSCARITHYNGTSTQRAESQGDFRLRDCHLFYGWQLYFRKHYGRSAEQEVRLVMLACVLLHLGLALPLLAFPRRRGVARRRLAKYHDALSVLFRGPESVGIHEWRDLTAPRAVPGAHQAG